MPDVKISQFSTAPSFNAADLVTGLQAGGNVNFSGTLIETFITRVGGPVALALAAKAPLASPALTGTPTAPTASTATNSTQLATTAFVHAVAAAIGTGVSSFNGRTGVVIALAGDYNKSMVGLANVDNTADADKPISTAQAAVNATKANIAQAIGRSSTYILTAADDGNIIVFSGPTNCNLTIPTGLRVGFACQVWRGGTGTVTLNPSGVTLFQRAGFLSLAAQYSGLTLVSTGTNEFIAQGDMA